MKIKCWLKVDCTGYIKVSEQELRIQVPGEKLLVFTVDAPEEYNLPNIENLPIAVISFSES